MIARPAHDEHPMIARLADTMAGLIVGVIGLMLACGWEPIWRIGT